MKFSWKGYWAPTPKGIRKIADALLAGCLTIAGFAASADHPTLGITIAIIGGVAKFVSNFFTDDEEIK
jgi:hypothetical protein